MADDPGLLNLLNALWFTAALQVLCCAVQAEQEW